MEDYPMQDKKPSESATFSESSSTTPASPSPPELIARFNGKGRGIPGIPARDLTAEETEKWLDVIKQSHIYDLVEV